MGKLINYAEYQAGLAERGVDITMADGQVFHVDPPQLWPDGIAEITGVVEQAQLLLGDRYDAYIAAGGSSARVFDAILKDGFDTTVPE